MPSDRVELRGLRILGTHGLLTEERARPQPFEVDLDLYLDMTRAGSSDRIEYTADYAQAAEAVVAVVGGTRVFDLLEALATAIAEEVLAASPLVERVAVSLRKLRPPMGVDVATVGVRISRDRVTGRAVAPPAQFGGSAGSIGGTAR